MDTLDENYLDIYELYLRWVLHENSNAMYRVSLHVDRLVQEVDSETVRTWFNGRKLRMMFLPRKNE